LHVNGKEECLVSISQIVHPMDIHPINIHLLNVHLMNVYPTWMSQIWPSSQQITMIHWAHLITSYFIHNYLFRFTSCHSAWDLVILCIDTWYIVLYTKGYPMTVLTRFGAHNKSLMPIFLKLVYVAPFSHFKSPQFFSIFHRHSPEFKPHTYHWIPTAKSLKYIYLHIYQQTWLGITHVLQFKHIHNRLDVISLKIKVILSHGQIPNI
jgi:hypothetical protein